MKDYGKIDSKFRFVILASKRAKQLLEGAKLKIKSRSTNLIRIAQEEVKMGFVDYRIIEPDNEEIIEEENEVLLGKELGAEKKIKPKKNIKGTESDKKIKPKKKSRKKSSSSKKEKK